MSIPVFSPRISRLLPLAAALLFASAVPAVAQTANEPTGLQQFLGKLGVLDIPEGPPIDYRERAPLVVPPSTELIPPRGLEDVKQINPDWPTDVDLELRRAAAAEGRKTIEEQRGEFHSGRRLTLEEMRRGTISKREAAKRQSVYTTAGEELSAGKERYSPDQLGFKGWSSKQQEKAAVFTGEPERTSLTDPPSGYRLPSANAPYGVIESKKENWKPPTLFERTSSPEDKGAKQ